MGRLLSVWTACSWLLVSGCGREASEGMAKARLSHPDPVEREAALAEMGQSGPLDQRALLRSAFLDPDPRIRRDAALILEEGSGAPLEETALRVLEGDRPDVEVAESLLQDRREALRVAAIGALSRRGTPRGWALLADRLSEEPSEGLRILCARSVAEGASRGGGAFHGRLLDALRSGLSDRNAEVRVLCARALAGAGDPSGAGLLAQALASAGSSSRGDLLALLRTGTGEDLGEEPGPWLDRYGVKGGTR